MLVVSDQMFFINGARVRPGTPFEYKGKDIKKGMRQVGSNPISAQKGKANADPETFSELTRIEAEASKVPEPSGKGTKSNKA